MALKFLDSGALDPTINPIYEAETTPTSGLSVGTNTQPSSGSIVLDTANNVCDQKWATYSANMTFQNQEEYMKAYRQYLSVCLNTGVSSPIGTSVVVEPDLGGIKPPKDTGNVQGGLYPSCLKKWQEYASTVKFTSTEAYELAKKEFMTKCMTGSSSSTTTTTTTTTGSGGTTTNVILPNLGGFLGSLTGGVASGGGGATEEEVLSQKKKPFPYWLIVVAVVGGYLIFRKK